MKEFLSNLNLQDMWEDIPEQIGIWVNIATSKLLVFLDPLYQNALINPLPTGALLLALIGIPLIFLKIKNSKSKSEAETDDRLDQLMEEMQSFEIKTPLIDLQKNFSDSPITDMEPLRQEESSMKFDFQSSRDESVPDSDHIHEILESDNMIELPSLISNEESRENDNFSLSEEQETADTPSLTDSIENQFRLDDDKELEREGLTEQASDWSQISRPALSGYDDTELTIEGIENLQQEIEKSILDLPSEQENKDDLIQEIKVAPTSPAPEAVEPASQDEDIEETVSKIEEEIHCQEDDARLPSTNPVATESEADRELFVAEEDHLIPHQENFEESFDNQVQSTVSVPEDILKEPQFPQSLPLKPILKSQPHANHTRIKSPNKDYKKLLESFILLKDQKR
jgi:hypothetical protein